MIEDEIYEQEYKRCMCKKCSRKEQKWYIQIGFDDNRIAYLPLDKDPIIIDEEELRNIISNIVDTIQKGHFSL